MGPLPLQNEFHLGAVNDAEVEQGLQRVLRRSLARPALIIAPSPVFRRG
jgi:hypothetical protein